MASVRKRAWASGRVQGVCYRISTQREAARLGLEGWVRNLRDGRVELLAEGPAEAVEQLLSWCRQGPALARVEGLRIAEDYGQEALGEFEVRPTL